MMWIKTIQFCVRVGVLSRLNGGVRARVRVRLRVYMTRTRAMQMGLETRDVGSLSVS
jgi:hypothetical protein